MNTRRFSILLLLVALAGCGGDTETKEQTGAEPVQEATEAVAETAESDKAALSGAELAQKYLIVDTHIDTPYRLLREWENIVEGSTGQFDYPRAIEGGLNVPFMSIYIPASVDEEGGAKARAEELIDIVGRIVSENPDKFGLAFSTSQVIENFTSGRISMAMGMENGGPIEGDLDNVQYFHDLGIRYITLAHSRSNHISDSSYDDNKQWGGLSDFGKTLVPEMNRVGIMIDVSHVSDEAFYDVIELSKAPVIASHSSARHFVPGFERNMSDDMIRKLAENGGVMQLNIGSSFIDAESRAVSDKRSELIAAAMQEGEIDPGSDEAREIRLKIFEENPYVYSDMNKVLDHIDHVVELVGIDHIGMGSDFDGVGDTLPEGFKDVSNYPDFIDGLIERGYSEQDIEKILGGNLMRVWREVEAYAAAN